jgi:hypothetical protein
LFSRFITILFCNFSFFFFHPFECS